MRGPAIEALLDKLENKRRHDVLSARLLVGDALTRAIATRRLDQFVQGQRTVFVSRLASDVGRPTVSRATLSSSGRLAGSVLSLSRA